jgi:CrcB protein
LLKFIYIGLGGFFGAIGRYSISKWVANKYNSFFPYGTLVVNLLGSFLLGFLLTYFLDKSTLRPIYRTAITTGFLGALTTFSTFGFETVMLFGEESYLFAFLNVILNLILGLMLVFIGIKVAKLM